MNKDISLTVYFHDDFTPPEKFDGCEERGATRSCLNCPFYHHDVYEPYEDCVLGGNDECPIRKFF